MSSKRHGPSEPSMGTCAPAMRDMQVPVVLYPAPCPGAWLGGGWETVALSQGRFPLAITILPGFADPAPLRRGSGAGGARLRPQRRHPAHGAAQQVREGLGPRAPGLRHQREQGQPTKPLIRKRGFGVGKGSRRKMLGLQL